MKVKFNADVLKISANVVIANKLCDPSTSNQIRRCFYRNDVNEKGEEIRRLFVDDIKNAKTEAEKHEIKMNIMHYINDRLSLIQYNSLSLEVLRTDENFYKNGETYSIPTKEADRICNVKSNFITIDNSDVIEEAHYRYIVQEGMPQIKKERFVAEKVA